MIRVYGDVWSQVQVGLADVRISTSNTQSAVLTALAPLAFTFYFSKIYDGAISKVLWMAIPWLV